MKGKRSGTTASRSAKTKGAPGARRVEIDHLPVATLITRKGFLVAANAAFEQVSGWSEARILGSSVPELIARLIDPRDHAVLEQLSLNRTSSDPRERGRLWCRVVGPDGKQRPVRVDWRLVGEEAFVFLLDAQPEAFGQEVTAALSRVAGALSRCDSEAEVLDQAVDALSEFGFTATVLLWDEHEPLLRYGPTRLAYHAPSTGVFQTVQPRRDILVQLNPSFMDRKGAFFQDGVRVVREAFPEPLHEKLLPSLPAQRMVQAPLFVGDAPYGALVVTSDALTPLVATALELFGELIGKALETIRLRRENVERERLAALGEAAGVMAHEVRNPVGAIMNSLALLERENCTAPAGRTLLGIIAEETTRLEQLVTQLLELGRPLLPRPRAYPLEELTRQAVRLLAGRGELGDRSLEMPASDETLAWIDPDLTELALVNVLRNAAQSTGKHARLRLSIETTDVWARWTLDDDGPGIPDEIVRRLGQPFVTTRATGTGMGLAVVRRIVEASGGRLSVARAELGGAQVSLDFPRAGSQQADAVVEH